MSFADFFPESFAASNALCKTRENVPAAIYPRARSITNSLPQTPSRYRDTFLQPLAETKDRHPTFGKILHLLVPVADNVRNRFLVRTGAGLRRYSPRLLRLFPPSRALPESINCVPYATPPSSAPGHAALFWRDSSALGRS